MGISSMYKDQTEDLSMLSKAELISKNFTQLVMQNTIPCNDPLHGMPSGLASRKHT